MSEETATERFDASEIAERVEAGIVSGEVTSVVDSTTQSSSAEEVMRGDDLLMYRLLSGTGARVGRFLVKEHMDEGGMGLIFRAHDEELDRPVALKILRASQSEGVLGRARLIREAQALAKLSHPNVVTVYEVGEWQGHIFVAMELIEGMTLAGWIGIKERGWREIIDMFIQAGRGLAVAHSMGIVHRDFKLSNALIGDDGRLRVLDFGIALAVEQPAKATTNSNLKSVLGTEASLLNGSLTVAGTIAGTPSYMAPEQLVGAAIDARADQYSFCVALYRGLYRKRVFRGRSIQERRQELLDEVEIEFPSKPRVPSWLQRIIRRGLDSDPDCRYPTMEALLEDLANDRTGRRKWVLGASLGGALLLAGGYVAAQQKAALADPCQEVGDELEEVWGEQQRTALERAIEGTGLSYGAVTWQRLEPLLDGYAKAWTEQRTEICESYYGGLHDAALYGLQKACLKRRRAALGALVRALAETERESLGRALQAAEALPLVAECGDAGVLTAKVPPPASPEEAAEVELLRERLAEARVEDEMGRYERGLLTSTEVLSRSETLGYTPLHAEVLFVHGSLLASAGDYEAADEILTRGVWRADVIGDDEQLAETMAMLIAVLAKRSKYERGYNWRPHAEAVIERLGGDTRGEARLLAEMCALISLHGDDSEEAIRLGTLALEITEGLYGREGIQNVAVLRVLGGAYYRGGNLKDAERIFERSLRLVEGELGLEHPKIIGCLNNLGAVKDAKGDSVGALVLMKRALVLGEATLGFEHPSLVTTIYNIGTQLTLGENRDDALAQAYLERALALNKKAHGREHRLNAMILHGLAALRDSRDDLGGALAYLEEAHVICEATLDSSAPLALQIIGDLGELYDARGEPERALPLLERAFELNKMSTRRRSLGAEAGFHLAKVLRQLEPRRSEAREVSIEALARFKDLYEDELYNKEHGEMVALLEEWVEDPDA